MEGEKGEGARDAINAARISIEKSILRHGRLDEREKELLLRHLASSAKRVRSDLLRQEGSVAALLTTTLRSLADETMDQSLMDSLREGLSIMFPRVPGSVYQITPWKADRKQ